MANWTRVDNGSTAGNISMNVDIGIQSVTRTSNTNVRVVYGVRFAMATSTYTYNSIAAFCPKDSGNRYYAFKNGSGHTASGTWYYANTSGSTTTWETCPFTIDIPVSLTQTSASFEVGYGWDAHTPNQKGSSSITVSFPTGATAPTGCWCSASAVSETQINLSGGYGSDGGASVSGSGYQYSTDQNTWYGCGSTFYGSANTTYYFRYYASNSQGTSYSGNASAKTYNYPYITSAPNFKIGNQLTIGIYNPLGRSCAVYIIRPDNESKGGDTTTGTGISGYNNQSWKNFWYGGIPNSKSGTYKVRLVCSALSRDTTVNGGTYSIQDNGTENPTFGVENIIDVVDTLNVAITGDNTKFIKGHNTLTGKITPMSSNYYANLDYYSISATGLATQTKNYSTSNISFTLNNLTTNSFVVNAVDKRTLSTPATKSIILINYDNPTLTEAVITRQNGTGTYIDVDFKGNYTNWQGLAQNNAVASAKYKYKKVGNTTWSSWVNIPTSAITNTNGVWEIKTTFNTVFSNTDKYDLELSITDKLETVSFTGLVVSTANAMIWKDLQNKYVGIGKKPSKTLDVAGDINTDGALYVNGVKMIWYE